MNMKKLALTLAVISTISACTIANATQSPESSQALSFYVYEDCELVKKIQMSEHQIKAYTALKKHESSMKNLEIPVKEMERKLAVHERELDALSSEMVIETADKMIVNTALVDKHTAIADKMEKIVAEHMADINELEREARKIEQVAHEFEQALEPSLGKYKFRDVNIHVGKPMPKWECRA